MPQVLRVESFKNVFETDSEERSVIYFPRGRFAYQKLVFKSLVRSK